MDFSVMGSISNYTKTMELETKWRKKKAEGDLGPQSKKKTDLEIKNEQFKESYKSQQEENDEDKKLENINNKLAADTELTHEEMEYLREKNPVMYQKLKNIEDEKKSYEKELKSCKTKEEYERLKFSKVNQSLSVIKSVQSNSNISDGEKLAIAQGEMRRMHALNKISAKFIKNGEYDKLPAEHEVHKFEKELHEAEQAEKENLYDGTDTKISENIKPDDEAKTKLDVELSPEAQKIKRSKAKRAYEGAAEQYIIQISNDNSSAEIKMSDLKTDKI